MRWRCCALVAAWLSSALAMRADSSPVELSLPTENDALFRGGGADFYQYIEREFQGERSKPWEGGRYGFVRDPVQTPTGLVYTRFHEGIDIRPLRRDVQHEPLDQVRAIADGAVVHINSVPGYSSYGRYVVIEHVWNGSPYYSLYGHLSEIATSVGTSVHRGERIARMGYSGEGLSQARAHLHLELNLMLNRNFEDWHDHYFAHDPNHNGIYNGINLAGIDIARFYLEQRERPELTVPRFLAEEETFYKVKVPASPRFDLRKWYPWMIKNEPEGAKSWEISFARSGVPLEMEARGEAVAAPMLTYVKKSEVKYEYLTRGVIEGSGAGAHLSESGTRLMRLLTWPD